MPDNCVFEGGASCPALTALTARVEAIEKQQSEDRQFRKDFYLWKEQKIESDATLNQKIAQIDENVRKLLSRQEQDDLQPKKLQDGIVKKVLEYAAVAIVAALLALIGLKG